MADAQLKGMAVHGNEVILKINGNIEVPLREIPEFSTKATVEKIDVTCLNDKGLRHINGIADFSSNEISFKTLYDTTLYSSLDAICDGKQGQEGEEKEPNDYVLTLSDGSTFTLKGTHSITYHGGGVNTAAEMSIVITMSEDPTFKIKGN